MKAKVIEIIILTDELQCEIIEHIGGSGFVYTLKRNNMEFILDWNEISGVWAYAKENHLSNINDELRKLLTKMVEIFNSKGENPE